MKSVSVIIRVTLIAMIVITPWFFGGVWAITQWILLSLATVLLAADLLTRFGRYDLASWIPTTWLPLLLGIGLGVFQLVPCSPQLARRVAPYSYQLRHELTSPAVRGQADAGSRAHQGGLAVTQTRSIYPAATREYVSLLALATAVFLLASSHAIDRVSLNWLFALVAICGAAFSFFGLVQRLSWNGKFYWLVETTTGNATSFGPYVNRNNAGGLLNMCLAASLGLLFALHWNKEGSSSTSNYRGRSSRRRRVSTADNPDQGPPAPAKELPVFSEHRSVPPPPPVDQPGEDLVERYAAMLDPTGQDSANPDLPIAGQSTERTAESPSPGDPGQTDRPKSVPAEASESTLSRSSGKRVKVRERVRVQRTSQEIRAERFAESARRSSYSIYSKQQPFVVRVSSFFSDYFASVNARKLWSVALAALIAAGVICTASRGSIVAMVVAALVTASGLAAKSGYRGYAVGLLAILIGGIGLMSWAGQTEFVQNRLARLFEDENLQSGRLPNWREALQAVPHYWTLGSGLGTYRYSYESFQHRYLAETAHFHAENQYLQALVEGGLIALILLVLAIVLTLLCIVRLFASSSATDLSLAVTGAFALASQVVGGAFDFGLYIPANTLLMAMICGTIIGRAALISSVGNLDWIENRRKADRPIAGRERAQAYIDSIEPGSGTAMLPPPAPHALITGRRLMPQSARWPRDLAVLLPVPAIVAPLIVGLLLIICMFASLEMHKTALIESAMSQAPLLQVREIADPALVRAAMTPLESTLGQRWDDANAHRHFSELHQQMYRSKTYQRLLQEAKKAGIATSPAPADADKTVAERDDALWRRAATWHLHRTIRELERASDRSAIEKLVAQPEVVDHLLPALRHMMLARQFCPTIPHVHYALAELSILPGAEPEEVIHLDRAKSLSPADATLLFWSGVLELNSGRVDQACADWNRSLSLSRLHLDEILSSARGVLTVTQLLDQVIPPRSDLLLEVAQKYSSVRARFLGRAAQALPQTELPPDQHAIVAATIYTLLGKPREARVHYAKAVSLRPQDLDLQFKLASLLFDMGELEAAREHAQNIYMLRPLPEYRALLEKIERAIIEQSDQ
jgi:tetratricopeptide (TPR) repeat protein